MSSTAEPGQSDIFSYGSAGRKNVPFQGGLLLVQGPLKRTPPMTTGPEGQLALPVALDVSMVGEQRNYQFWFRDPGSPRPYGLSDAVEVAFCP